MMPTTNLKAFERQTKTFEDLVCSPSSAGGLQQQPIYFTEVHILLSLMEFLGNFLILVALHKVSSLHPPSKLLYRCLATTDQLSIVSQPFKERFLCRFTYKATYITAYSLCSVPLLTMAAISVGRFLALLSGLRYRQIQCNFRAHVLHGSNLLGTVWRRWFMLLDYRIDT